MRNRPRRSKPRGAHQPDVAGGAPSGSIAPAGRAHQDELSQLARWPSDSVIVVGEPCPAFQPRAPAGHFRPFPYRPDTLADGWSTDAFTVRAASVRGYAHRYDGTPRQDDFAIALAGQPQRVIIAVADGVSSAPQSHLGATYVSRYVVQWLAASAGAPTSAIDWPHLIESAAWALVEHAAAISGHESLDAEEAERLVATTLVCAVVEPCADRSVKVQIVSVGDSAAWILREGQFESVVGSKSPNDGGVTSSLVSGLPRVPVDVSATSAVFGPDDVLLLGTDGFGDPLGSGDGAVGDLFRSLLTDRIPSVIEFAHVLDFSRITFDDDRTLVALWPVQVESDSKGGDEA